MSPVLSRILVAALLLPLVIGLVYLGGWWLFGLALAGGLLALHELYVMGRLSHKDVDAETLAKFLDTHVLPDPDLVIRTSGEARISNFLLWQSAYAELVFDDTLWPDFGEERLRAAVDEYASRRRRFGAR